MSHDRIHPTSCTGEYGTPSGHAFFSAYLPTLLALYYLNSTTRVTSIRSKWVANTIYIILFLYTILISFSRVYNGVHTIDQVLYGLQLGWFCAFYMHVNLKNFLLNHITQFLSGDISAKRDAVKHFILLLVVFVLFFSLFLIPYAIVKTSYEQPGTWGPIIASN